MRTLADMTPEERKACVGMWCDNLASTATEPSPVVLACVQGDLCWILHTDLHGRWSCFPLGSVAPRTDLMRVWNPDGTPVSANVSYDVQGYSEATGEWGDFFGHRRCTLRRAKRDLIEAREDNPNIKWRLAMRHEPHLTAIPDDYQEPGEGDE